jgi:NTE family protein
LLDLSVSSKFNTDWDFLSNLRDRGRAAAMHWLEATIDDIGVRSSVHLRREYLNAGKMA